MSERDNIFVVDSQQVTLPLMVLILEAVAMREKGWNARQIKEALEAMRGQVKVIAVVDTLDYLQKGGRLSKAAAIAGNFLKIKPLIGVQEGQVVVLSKARGKNRRSGSPAADGARRGRLEYGDLWLYGAGRHGRFDVVDGGNFGCLSVCERVYPANRRGDWHACGSGRQSDRLSNEVN